MLKKIIKKYTTFNKKYLRSIKYFLLRYKNADIFNEIYKKGYWANTGSGSGSHNPEIIEPYIIKVREFLTKIKPITIVDLGCGDFNVGKNFVDLTQNYIACDISSVILDRNKTNFSNFNNVNFKLLDLCNDQLPDGDVCFVRQVLQHLSNKDIINFIEKLNINKQYKYLILTEHLPLGRNFKVNLDILTGQHTRISNGSGVVLHKQPFNLDYESITELIKVLLPNGEVKTTLYKL